MPEAAKVDCDDSSEAKVRRICVSCPLFNQYHTCLIPLCLINIIYAKNVRISEDGVHFAKLWHKHDFSHTVNSVALSGDTRKLAGGDAKGEVIVYDFDEKCEVFRWRDSNQVYGVALSHSGEELGVCGASKSARIFNVLTGAESYHRTAADRMRACSISRDGRQLAVGGFDGCLNVCNAEAGARLHSFEQHEIVRSVSMDLKGVVFAMGCDDGRCVVHDLSTRDGLLKPRWVAKHKSKVWVVAVSPDGLLVAAGDYANTVKVYLAENGVLVWEKTSWTGKGAPFTWGLAFSGNSHTLAIGHWDAYAYVVDVTSWSDLATLKRSDRVYSVALDHDGGRVAVGGRDKCAVVYRLTRAGEATKPRTENSNGTPEENAEVVCDIKLDAFVYAVALSSSGARMAVGCVDNQVSPLHFVGYSHWTYRVTSRPLLFQVHIIDVDKGLQLRRLNHDGLVQSVAFSPGSARHLAVGGEEKAVIVWELDPNDDGSSGSSSSSAPSQCFVMPRPAGVHAVAFSGVSLAFAAGSLATVYGIGHHADEWTERPSFEVAADMIDHPQALACTLARHPTILNTISANGKETLLQYTVRKKSAGDVEALLAASCRFGLIQVRRARDPGVGRRRKKKYHPPSRTRICFAHLHHVHANHMKRGPALMVPIRLADCIMSRTGSERTYLAQDCAKARTKAHCSHAAKFNYAYNARTAARSSTFHAASRRNR